MSIENAQTDKNAMTPHRQVSNDEESSSIKEAINKVAKLENKVSSAKRWELGALALAGFAAVFVFIFSQISDSRNDALRKAERALAALETEKLTRESNEKIAVINREADKARKDQGQLRKDSLVLESSLEKTKLELAKLKEPRSLTPEQITGLSKRLKPYAGISIDILQIGESPEITHFRSLIEIPLRTAGLRPLSSTAVGSGSLIGLSVGVLADAKDTEKIAATALLSGFNAEGITALDAGIVKREDWPGFVMAPQGETVNKAPIRIYIGSKP